MRFDSKCNGKALKGLRIFQADNSSCSMNGWEGDLLGGYLRNPGKRW